MAKIIKKRKKSTGNLDLSNQKSLFEVSKVLEDFWPQIPQIKFASDSGYDPYQAYKKLDQMHPNYCPHIFELQRAREEHFRKILALTSVGEVEQLQRSRVLSRVIRISSHMKLSPETLHLAVELLDLYTCVRTRRQETAIDSIHSINPSSKDTNSKKHKLGVTAKKTCKAPTTILETTLSGNNVSKYAIVDAAASLILAIKWQYGGAGGCEKDYNDVIEGFKEPVITTEEMAKVPLPRKSVIQTEMGILRTLEWDIGPPTMVTFLRFFLDVVGAKKPQCIFAICLCDRILFEQNILRYSPSKLAACALWLSQEYAKMQPAWDEKLSFYAYPVSELKTCRDSILAALRLELETTQRFRGQRQSKSTEDINPKPMDKPLKRKSKAIQMKIGGGHQNISANSAPLSDISKSLQEKYSESIYMQMLCFIGILSS